MIKMNIHKALSTKKLLDKRIEKGTDNLIPVGYKMKSSATEYRTKEEVDRFNKETSASYIQVKTLIENYNKICRAITLSNATTKVEINGKEMTVSDAINRKNNIEYEEDLLRRLKYEYTIVLDKVKERNDLLESKIDNLREVDKKEKIDKQNTYDLMRENESWELIDPLDIKKVISEMEDDILKFKSEVDFALSTSNAQTIIEVDIDEV